MQNTLFSRVGTFDIVPSRNGFRIQDTAAFNNWGMQKEEFATQEEAEDYARRCHDFKEGRRMSVD